MNTESRISSLPCPICREELPSVNWRRDGSFVECDACGHIGPIVCGRDLTADQQDDLAILAWNHIDSDREAKD